MAHFLLPLPLSLPLPYHVQSIAQQHHQRQCFIQAQLQHIEKLLIDAQLKEEIIQNRNKVVMVSWQPPPFGTYTLNTDGCSKGNPGESGSGGIIRDFTGNFVAAFSFRIGFDCAAYAEIWALYEGLKLAQKTLGSNADLIIECDSIEVVSVMLGQHGKNYKYIDVVESCRRMLTTFKNVSIRHVYREANQCADYLANKSLSLDRMGLKEWNNIPDLQLMSLVRSDQMGTATPRICKGVCKPRFYK